MSSKPVREIFRPVEPAYKAKIILDWNIKNRCGNIPAEMELTQPDKIIDVEGDGNCFFNCLSLALFNTEAYAPAFRKRVMETVKENKQLLIDNSVQKYFTEGSNKYLHSLANYYDYGKKEFFPGVLDKRIKDMTLYNKNGWPMSTEWAEELEIFGASLLLGVPIYIYTEMKRPSRGPRPLGAVADLNDTWRVLYVRNRITSPGGIYVWFDGRNHYRLVCTVKKPATTSEKRRQESLDRQIAFQLQQDSGEARRRQISNDARIAQQYAGGSPR